MEKKRKNSSKIINREIIKRRLKKPLVIIRNKVEIEIIKFIKKKFKKFSKFTFKSYYLKKKTYKYKPRNRKQFLRKHSLFNISLYDLFKQRYRYLKRNKIMKYQKYLNISVYKKKKSIIQKLYRAMTSTKDKKVNRILVKTKFKYFFNKNNLSQIFNLKRYLPYPNFLNSKSEIQRSTVFRDLINKESAYYKNVKRSPLVILVSPKPKNIHVTIYNLSRNGYNIIWKKTTGMLDKVEGQLSLPALFEIFNKMNVFLTKHYLKLKKPLKLVIKSSKYFGTTNIIQNFVRIFQNNVKLNEIYFMYKYRKRFNFFSHYAILINDSVFNYLSSIWIKFLRIMKRTRMPLKYTFPMKSIQAYNKFFALEYNYAKRRYKINHLLRLRRINYLKNKKFKND